MRPLFKCFDSHRAIGYSNATAEPRPALVALEFVSDNTDRGGYVALDGRATITNVMTRHESDVNHIAFPEAAGLGFRRNRETEAERGAQSEWNSIENNSFLRQILAPIFSSRPTSSNGIHA